MIILSMIVRNEAHCIARCLRSVKPHIDAAVIVDTGSTDNTKEVIRQEIGDVYHTVHSRPWVDFAANRTEALRACSLNGTGAWDHILTIDADEELIVQPWLPLRDCLTKPVIGMWHTTPGGGRYVRPQLFSAKHDFYWKGVIHEEVTCDDDSLEGYVLGFDGCRIHDHFDSARNKDPDKTYKDALLLLQQPKTPRNTFYLAQAWRDAGYPENALYHYRLRATMGGFDQEVWYSLFMVGYLLEKLGHPPEDVKAAYNAAYLYRPSRAEPIRALARYLEGIDDYPQASICTEMADRIPMTADILYVDPTAYVS